MAPIAILRLAKSARFRIIRYRFAKIQTLGTVRLELETLSDINIRLSFFAQIKVFFTVTHQKALVAKERDGTKTFPLRSVF